MHVLAEANNCTEGMCREGKGRMKMERKRKEGQSTRGNGGRERLGGKEWKEDGRAGQGDFVPIVQRAKKWERRRSKKSFHGGFGKGL